MSSLLEYVRDYFFQVMEISVDDEIPKIFLKCIEERDTKSLEPAFEKLYTYVKDNDKDQKNLYFNRMRFYINQEFGTTLAYSHL